MIPVAISGACGRMAGQVLRRAVEDNDIELVAALDVNHNGEDIGEILDIGSIGVTISSDLESELQSKKPQLLIDFTNPETSVKNVKIAAANKVGIIIGTTGFTEDQLKTINSEFEKNGVVGMIVPNFSACVNLFFKIAAEAAKTLEGYDLEMVEAHHIHKKDAPSGTAKKLAEYMANAMGTKVEDIKINSIREGEIVGDHTVTFDAVGERMTISHHAKSRDAFAYGCLRAIKWMAKQEPGIYDMWDVLDLK